MGFDLSKKREENRKGKIQPNFDFEGKNFVLPWEVPAQVSVIGGRLLKVKGTEQEKDAAMGKGLVRIGQILLRDQWDAFLELGGSAQDIMTLLDNMDEIYSEMSKEESGESSASE